MTEADVKQARSAPSKQDTSGRLQTSVARIEGEKRMDIPGGQHTEQPGTAPDKSNEVRPTRTRVLTADDPRGKRTLRSTDMNPDFHLDHLKEIEGDDVAKIGDLLGTHPYIAKRIHAPTAFSKSDTYRRLSQGDI
jgi:hypothetical protein